MTYRVYCVDGAGAIRLAEWIDARSDEEAIEKARTMNRNGLKCEVWDRGRQVAVLDAQDLAA